MSYETGFKSGGFFFSSDSQVFQPEHLKAYTLGSKNRLLDDRLQVDVEAFHWRYDDQQISTITQDSRGVTNLGTRNVGDATMNGVEIETEWLVTDATRLRVGAQYLDATYDEFRYITPLSARAAVVRMRGVAGPCRVPGGLLGKAGHPTRPNGRRTWLPNIRSSSAMAPGSSPEPAHITSLKF